MKTSAVGASSTERPSSALAASTLQSTVPTKAATAFASSGPATRTVKSSRTLAGSTSRKTSAAGTPAADAKLAISCDRVASS